MSWFVIMQFNDKILLFYIICGRCSEQESELIALRTILFGYYVHFLAVGKFNNCMC